MACSSVLIGSVGAVQCWIGVCGGERFVADSFASVEEH